MRLSRIVIAFHDEVLRVAAHVEFIDDVTGKQEVYPITTKDFPSHLSFPQTSLDDYISQAFRQALQVNEDLSARKDEEVEALASSQVQSMLAGAVSIPAQGVAKK